MKEDYSGDSYTYWTDDDSVQAELSRIRTERGDIICEIEVNWHGALNPGLLHHGKLNLVSDRSVGILANQLRERVDSVDWAGFFTAVTYMAKNRYRNGEPPIRLSDVDTDQQTKWLLRPLLETGGPTVLAAPGGSAKSMLALAVAATVATNRGLFLGMNPRESGPVLYLDWEADKYAHRNRLDAMCAAVSVDVPTNLYYRREYAPLHESTDELARQVKKLGAVMVVVDSKGASLSGAPEEADGTLRFFRALRTIGVPALVVDHVTNAAADRKGGASRPFGSVYTQNMARNVWMAKKSHQEEGQTTVLWQHTKSNNGPTGRQMAWRMDFKLADGGKDTERYESIRVSPVAPVTVALISAGQGTVKDQIADALRKWQIPMTVSELAEATQATEVQVRARLAEGAKEGLFLNASSGKLGQWIMAADNKQTKGTL